MFLPHVSSNNEELNAVKRNLCNKSSSMAQNTVAVAVSGPSDAFWCVLIGIVSTDMARGMFGLRIEGTKNTVLTGRVIGTVMGFFLCFADRASQYNLSN